MIEGFESEVFNSRLCSLGEFYPLRIFFDDIILNKELELEKDKWIIYNKSMPECNRYGLSLFSLDGKTSGEIDLNSIKEYNKKNQTNYTELSFRTPTHYWKKLSAISTPLKKIERNLGRSHLIKLDKNGFFPGHRDLDMNTFRLIAFFNARPDNLNFYIDDKKIHFMPYQLYFFNARRKHSLFSLKNYIILLVLNIELNKDSVEFVCNNLLFD